MPTPRQPVPGLKLPTVSGAPFDLATAHGDMGTLLVFYRGLHCPLCIKQLKEISEQLDAFAERGVNVVAVTADGEERAKEFAERVGSDKLTVAYDLPLETARSDWGLYLSTSRGKTSIGIEEAPIFPEPGLFLVLADGTLYFASVQTMPFARPSVGDILGALDFIKANGYPARGEYTGAV